MGEWNPQSWQSRECAQPVKYEDEAGLKQALEKINRMPPLVQPAEVDSVKAALADVVAGNRFLLQGGDCAERFLDCTSENLENKLKILLQMSLITTFYNRMPTVRIARIAGQYSKPRSSPTEVIDGKTYNSFRGDNINSFDLSDRQPSADRLLQGYFHSAATMNYIRSLVDTGFGNLVQAQQWDLGFVRNRKVRREYEAMVDQVLDALDFVNTCTAGDALKSSALNRADIYTSHEGMHLPLETALTRKVGDKYYNVGAHFIWIGDRTRQLDGAHVEYFRGITNPIGVKCGPTMKPDELVDLIRKLDANNEPGRITIISRYGAKKIRDHLPAHIQAVQKAGLKVLWSCDPMHGNTETSAAAGVKTRSFDNILSELTECFKIHEECGGRLGGVHLELTGDDVTECKGGPQELSDEHLKHRYETYCDPRLNYAQSMEVALQVAQQLSKGLDNGAIVKRRRVMGKAE